MKIDNRGKVAYYTLMGFILMIVFALAVSFSNDQVLANEDDFENELSQIIDRSFTDTDTLMGIREINNSTNNAPETSIPLQFQSMDKLITGEKKVEELFSSRSNNIVEQDLATLGNDFEAFKLAKGDQETAERKLRLAARLYAKYFPSSAMALTEESRIQLKVAEELLNEYFSHRTEDYYDPYALYFISSIEFRLWDEGKGMHGVVYSIYLINEFPNESVAEKAWLELRDYIQLSYSGTDGVNVPKDWENLLASLNAKIFRQ